MNRVNYCKTGWVLVLFFFINVSHVSAQLDWVSWTSVKLNYKAGDKLTIKLEPIWRQKNDLSEYDNTSVDVILSFKINKKWSVGVNNRHWFIPEKGDREFWYFEVNYKTPLSSKFTFSNRLRYHLGLDWNREDVDFLRWQPKISFKTGKKINPFIASEIFYRFPDDNVFARMRSKLGVVATISKKSKVNLEYWRQVSLTDKFNESEANYLIMKFSYNLN